MSFSQGKSSQLQPELGATSAGWAAMAGGALKFEAGVNVCSGSVPAKVGVWVAVAVAAGVSVKVGVSVEVGVAVWIGVLVGVKEGDNVGVAV